MRSQLALLVLVGATLHTVADLGIRLGVDRGVVGLLDHPREDDPDTALAPAFARSTATDSDSESIAAAPPALGSRPQEDLHCWGNGR